MPGLTPPAAANARKRASNPRESGRRTVRGKVPDTCLLNSTPPPSAFRPPPSVPPSSTLVTCGTQTVEADDSRGPFTALFRRRRSQARPFYAGWIGRTRVGLQARSRAFLDLVAFAPVSGAQA